MHPLVPELILSNARAGNLSGEFPAVGLFVDISGFSAMTEALMTHGRHGAEALAEILRAALDPMIESIFGQGGFVCTSAGDALTALFPVDGEPPATAVRALAAAWGIQAHMAGHDVFDTHYGSFRISAKVGLALGEARWGIVLPEDSRRAAYYFQGTAIDGCTEAEHHASAGEIVLGASLLPMLAGQVAVDPEERYRGIRQVAGELPAPRPLPPPDLNAAAYAEAIARFFPGLPVAQEFSGEFRHVVNLFIALPTVSTEAQLHIFMNSLFALQDKWGGLLNRLDFGDKGTHLLLFWGAPLAFENDIERALSFILDLQTHTSIPINAGITYRLAHAGFIGGRLHEEYTCFGRGVNLAARFMTAAPRGEIWVDEPVAERAAGKFEIEFVEERAFKGFAQPQKVFALYERKAEPRPFFRGALAGREEDLAALRAFLAPLFRGQFAGMLVVTGEPGIGKSRLVYEAVQSIEREQADRIQVFLAQTDEILRQPLNPFIYWLRRYLGVSETQGEARSKRSFNRRLDDLIAALPDRALAAELDRTRSFLGALVGLRWPDSLYEQLDAAGRYANTQIALITLIQAASLQAPVVFVLEDLHWLDDDSAALLSRLLRVLSDPGAPNCPVAILATSREDPDVLASEGAVALAGASFTQIALGGLTSAMLRLLAENLLGAPPAGALLDLIQQRAEGNPFFAEQTLHYLRDQGLLALEEGYWQISQAGMDELPVDVNALLVSRLDHLTQKVKEAVQTAAVLGREFEVNLLSAMLGAQAQSVPPEVAAAEREAIWTALTEIHYIFKHVLLREAAYQMQVQTRRKALHALAFGAYERLYAADLTGYYGALAYHAEQAGLLEEARRYLRLAGQVAAESYLNGQAAEYFSRALAITPESEPAERYELLMARESVYQLIGRQDERERDLAKMEALLPALNSIEKEIDFLLKKASLAFDLSFHSQVEEYAGRAAVLAGANGWDAKTAKAYRLMGTSFKDQGKYELAAAFITQAMQEARVAHSVDEEMLAQHMLGVLLLQDQMRLDAAHAAFTTVLDYAKQAGDWRLQASALYDLGAVSHNQGNYWASREYLLGANDLSRKIGDRGYECSTTDALGVINGKLGDHQKGRSFHEQAIRIAREIGSLSSEIYAQFNLSDCLVRLGEMEAAVEHARLALDLARKIGHRDDEAFALTYLGNSLVAQGALKGADEAYTAALAIRGELNQPVLAAEPAAGLARVALRKGDLAAARASIEPVFAHLEGGGSLDGCHEPLLVYLTAYQVLAQSGDQRADILLETAYHQLQDQAVKIVDEESRSSFLNNAHHKEIRHTWEKLHRTI